MSPAERPTLEELQFLLESKTIVEAHFVSRNGGGYSARLLGYHAFLPGSHSLVLNTVPLQEDPLVTTIAQVVIIEVRTNPFKLVVSRREAKFLLDDQIAAAEKAARVAQHEAKQIERAAQRTEQFAQLNVGTVVEATVAFNIPTSGGGATILRAGLLKIRVDKAEIGYGDAPLPERGQIFSCLITSFDPDRQQVCGSIKRLLPDPWETVADRYVIGSERLVRIKNVVNFGIFAELEPGVDCLIHRKEIPGADATTTLAHHFASGDQILVAIIAISPEQHRIGAAPVVPTLPNTEADRRREVEEILQRNSEGSPEVLRNAARAICGVQGDMYWAVDRFVFELLQNADDLPARPGGSVRVQVLLLPNHLVFQHNGLPFRHEHVLALANVGQSTKRTDANTTGYKGIGFKSVYSKSSCVYVRSGGYSFRFASQGNEDVPWQTWPRWTEPSEYPDELRADPDFFNDGLFPVSFGLQIQSGDHATYADVLRKLFRDPRFALFLRALDNIRVIGDDLDEIQLTRTRDPDSGQVVFDALGQQSTYLRHAYPVAIAANFKPSLDPDDAPPTKLPDKLLGIDTVSVQFAATLNPDTLDLVPMNPAEAALSAYLPTEDTTYGLSLLVNADFTLTSSRERVTLNNPWNEFLFRQIGRLLIQWLADRLREQPSRARYLYQFIPPAQESDEANKNQLALTAGVVEGIHTIPCLPAADNEDLLLPEQAVLDQVGLYHLLPAFYSAYLTDGRVVIHPDANPSLEATGFLERFNLWYIDLAELQAAFGREDASEFYTPVEAADLLMHLAADPASAAASWHPVRCLFDQHGQLVAPSEPNLYGALSEEWDSTFPLASQVRYLHPKLQEALAVSSEVAAWIEKELRIAPYTQQALVRNLLLPALSDIATDVEINDQGIHYLHQLHRQQKLQLWLSAADRKRLATIDVLCDDGNYHKIANCYLSHHYQPPVELEALADDIGKEQFPLVSETYLAQCAEPVSWREFWIYCGIPTLNAADLLSTKLLPANVQTAAWSSAKHEAVLRLALNAFIGGNGQQLPWAQLPKVHARTEAGSAALTACVQPSVHNPHLALLTKLPISPTPDNTLAADYFSAADPVAVANFFQLAGCKPWDEAITLTYACQQLLAARLDLAASITAVRQLYQWNQDKYLSAEHKDILSSLPLYQQDASTRRADASFFSSLYGPKHDIETLTDGRQKQLLTEAYLPADVTEIERGSWRKFFEDLGIVGEFKIWFHAEIPRATAEEEFPTYLTWADANPAICPGPHRNWKHQHSLKNFITINNLDLVLDVEVACLIAEKITAHREWILEKPIPVYFTSYGNLTWPAGSLLNAFPVVPCTGTPSLRPAYEVYSRHLAAVPAGAPVATVTYGPLELEARLGLQTQLTPDTALALLAQVSAGCQAGQPVTDQARSLFAKTFKEVQPWLTEKVKVAHVWRTKLLLPAANNTWLTADKAHLVTRSSLYLKTSGAILHDLDRAVSLKNYESFASALGIPLLTEKEFKLAQFSEADVKAETPQVLQRIESHRLFELLCDYRSLPPAQAAKWAEDAGSLVFAQVPALRRECTLIPNYRLEAEELHQVEDKQFYFVGYLWSACHWQALANFLVRQLDLPVAAHVVIRLLESNDPAAQAAVFEQAGYPVPASLQHPPKSSDNQSVLLPLITGPNGAIQPPISLGISAEKVDLSKIIFTTKVAPPVTQGIKPTSDTIASGAERTDIGRWCEELVHRYLLAHSDLYTDIEWPNQDKEGYQPYDFRARLNGIDTYIEVKGTPSLQKDIVYLSAAEWHWMIQYKERYSIFRVYGAKTLTPRIDEIPMPFLKLLNGELTPQVIELQV